MAPMPGGRPGPGQRIRDAVSRTLERLGGTAGSAGGPVRGGSRARPAAGYSQSSAAPADLSGLWAMEGDRLGMYRAADVMDAESDLTTAALNAWASTATAGALRPAASQPVDGGSGPVISLGQGTPLQAGASLLSVRCVQAGAGGVHPQAQGVAEQVFRDCHLSERAWSIARDVRKFGDVFLELVVDDSLRIRRIKSLPALEMVREEDAFGRLQPVAFRQVRSGADIARFAAWQIIHLRNNRQGGDRYGRSGLRTARRVWRMLSLLEDSLVNARFTRAYQKLVHFIPVTDAATEDERARLVEDYRRQMTATQVFDPSSGQLNSQPSPPSVTTDFYVTVAPSDSQKTGIQSIDPNNAQISQIADLEYFQNLLVAGLEVPKAYLGLERDVNSRATLSYQELHFLRQAGSLQATVNGGIRTALELAFTLAGIDPADVRVELDYGS